MSKEDKIAKSERKKKIAKAEKFIEDYFALCAEAGLEIQTDVFGDEYVEATEGEFLYIRSETRVSPWAIRMRKIKV